MLKIAINRIEMKFPNLSNDRISSSFRPYYADFFGRLI